MSHKYLPEGQVLYRSLPNITTGYQNIVDVPKNIIDSIQNNLITKSDIQVSVYCTSKREYLWKWLYDTLSMNKINFELVVVSPFYPTFELPKNFKLIHSVTKPVQCLQLAVLNCSGETIQCLADDCQSSPYSLDMLYKKYKEKNDYKCTIVPNFLMEVPKDSSIEGITAASNALDIHKNAVMRMVVEENNSPVAHAGGLMSRQFFNELGGFDKRFVMRYADLDLQMRAFGAGGTIELYQDVWVVERYDMCKDERSNPQFDDYTLYLNRWFRNAKGKPILSNLLKEPTSVFQPFENDGTLHEINQGTKDRWS